MGQKSVLVPLRAASLVALLILVALSAAQAGTVHFAVIGDRTGEPADGIYEQALAEIARLRPDFLMTVGDAIDGYTEDSVKLNHQWDSVLTMYSDVSFPIHHTPGNHDIQGAMSEQVYRAKIGEPSYSFTFDGGAIVVLDNSRVERSEDLEPDQVAWLGEQLVKYQNVPNLMVFMHKPLWYNSTALGKPDTLHTLFTHYGVDAVISGHFHSYFSGKFDGVRYVSIGSSGGGISPSSPGPKYHFAWVTVDDEGIHLSPILLGSVLPWDAVSYTEVFTASTITSGAVNYIEALKIPELGKGATGKVAVKVENLTDSCAWDNALHWSLPEGWTITPATVPVQLAPGETVSFGFEVTPAADLYPLPQLMLEVPYSDADTCYIHTDLDIDRQAECVRVTEAPTIDGHLDEACWNRMVHGLFDYDGTLSRADSTQVFFAYDTDHLYLAARCYESNLDSVSVSVTERDGPVYGDDCVGFMLQPLLGKEQGFQIYVNSIGVVYDQKLFTKEDKYYTTDRSWDSDHQIAVAKDEQSQSWSFEISLPLAQFGIDGVTGREIGLNFRRKMQRSSSAAHFQIPWAYDVGSYGKLEFE